LFVDSIAPARRISESLAAKKFFPQNSSRFVGNFPQNSDAFSGNYPQNAEKEKRLEKPFDVLLQKTRLKRQKLSGRGAWCHVFEETAQRKKAGITSELGYGKSV